MAGNLTEAPRIPLKKKSEVSSIREENRNDSRRANQDKRFKNLFHKRTRLYYDETRPAELITVDEVKELSKAIKKRSKDTEDQLRNLILAFGTDCHLVEVFLNEDNALSKLVGYLTGKDSQLQIYAAYCITNITASEHSKQMIVAKSCAPYLIAYLSSENEVLQDLCACALGNIASNGERFRKLLIVQGIMKPLVDLFKVTAPTILESAAYAAIKLCAGSDEAASAMLSLGIGNLLLENMKKESSKEAQGPISWLLAALASSDVHLKALAKQGVAKIAVEYLKGLSSSIVDNVLAATSFLRLLGNMLTLQDKELTNEINKETSIFCILKEYLNSSYLHIVKETLWVLSNIMVLGKSFASRAVDENMVPILMKCLGYGNKIQKEALVCICSLASYGGNLIEDVVSPQLVDQLMFLLKCNDEENVFLAVQLTEMILRQSNRGSQILVEKNGIASLQALQHSMNEHIKIASHDLLVTYFSS